MPCSKCENLIKSKNASKLGSKGVTKEKNFERKVGLNMLLERNKCGFNPAGSNCFKCKKRLPNDDKFCNLCAYQQGKCKMCGVKILCTDTYKQSTC